MRQWKNRGGCYRGSGNEKGSRKWAFHVLQRYPKILWCFLLTPQVIRRTIRAILCISWLEGDRGLALPGATLVDRPPGGKRMQYLPGCTVQCINPGCDARGHWLRADATG